MIFLCNYCDRHTSADGLKWILNDLTKVEYTEPSGKAVIVEAMDPYGPPLLQSSLQSQRRPLPASNVPKGDRRTTNHQRRRPHAD